MALPTAALRCAAPRASARTASAMRQGRPEAAPAAPRAAPPRRSARSPLRETVAAAVPPRRAAVSIAEAPTLPSVLHGAPQPPVDAPGTPAAELRRRSDAQDAARLRLEQHWVAGPAVALAGDFQGLPEDIGSESRPMPLAADSEDDAHDDSGVATVRRAPLTVRGQRLHANRSLAQQRALSLSRATSRRACFDSRQPVQRLHPVRRTPRCAVRATAGPSADPPTCAERAARV